MRNLFADILILLFAEYSGVTLAVLADLATGLRKSRREGRCLTSRGLRRTVRKLVSYFLALFSLTVVDGMVMVALVIYGTAGGGSPVPVFPFLTSMGAVSLALIELKSVCENSPHRDALRQAAGIFMKLRKRVGL
ncbi:MAG: phage holin family protein [Duncaniella sp.]|nr:phage holin family protein [Duncaniella sp.]MDE5752474.1 phage holin family protein [Duncaniella sp.]MDE6170270.1 phage holin family protein [Duncaniella sp.]MDE6328421.1 phage holin family protein [Duncaniella sp.]MDE6465318.1 phage holin family protein [Duncaniella sp.]